MPKRPKTYMIRRGEQLAAMASPVRQEIMDALAAGGPCSVSDLAGRLGRAADGLYHHLRLLLRVGLIVEHSRRKTAYRTEVVYAPVNMARRIQAHIDPRSPRSMKSWEQAVATLLRLGIVDFRRALQGSPIVTQGAGRNLWCGRIKAYLTAEQLTRVNQLMDELFGLLSQGRPAGNAKLHAVTCLLVPSKPSSRSRKLVTATSTRRSSSANSGPAHGR